jgi:hypothetical protein
METHRIPNVPRQRLRAAALIAAPAVLVASSVAYLADDGFTSGSETAGAIQVWAAIALGLAITGLAARLDEPMPRAAAILTLTGAIGVAGSAAFGIDSMVMAIDPAAALSEGEGGPAVGLGLLLPGMLMPLTLLGLGIASFRAEIQPRAAAASLALGGLLFPISRIGDIAPLALTADLLIAAGMVPMGVAALRRLSSGAVPAVVPARRGGLEAAAG